MDQPRRLLTGRNRAARILAGVPLAFAAAYVFPQYALFFLIALVVFTAWQLRAYANEQRSKSA